MKPGILKYFWAVHFLKSPRTSPPESEVPLQVSQSEQSDVDVGCWGCSMNYDANREEISRTYNFMEFCSVLILFLDATVFKGN